MMFFLALALLGSVVLVPLAAAWIVWFELAPRGSRIVAWLGLSIGLGTASTLPLFSLFIANSGASAYRFAPVVGIAGIALGLAIVRVHLLRLKGRHSARWSRPIAWTCVGFGAFIAVALLPVMAGGPLPAACGEFGTESCGPGGPEDYAQVVVPLMLGMLLEAWLLLRAQAADER